MKFIRPSLILALVCTLFLPEPASAEPSPDKWEQGRVEKRRNTLNRELESLKKSRDVALKTKQRTDTIDLALEMVQEELEVLADGREETREERLSRTLSNYKRQRALHIKLGQDTSGLDKMIASAERQLKGGPGHAPKPRPSSKPETPPSKPKTAMSERMREAKIKGAKTSIKALEGTIERYRSRGHAVPQHLLDRLEKKQAELAELQK